MKSLGALIVGVATGVAAIFLHLFAPPFGIALSIIGSYFPFDKVTLYGIAQHTSRLTQNINPDIATDWVIPMQYTSIGAGLKYQPKSLLQRLSVKKLQHHLLDAFQSQ